MRIIQITPGTGNFHCGSCLRDHALVRALRARGHDAVIVPLYLPLVTDEPPGNEAPLFFGGISVYLEQKFRLLRRPPAWLDRLLNRPALLRFAAGKSHMTQAAELGEMTLSMLRGEDGNQAAEIDKLVDWLRAQPAPDAICLSNSMLAGMARRLRQDLGAPVVCTLQGEDSFLDSLPQPHRQQAWDTLKQRCADLDQFIAVSRWYGELMRERLALPADRLTVVYNGIALDGFAPAPSPPATPTIGYLARMTPGKGLGRLVDAFIELKQRARVSNLTLRVAGAKTPGDEPFVRGLQQKLAGHGLARDTEFLPNLDRAAKQQFLRTLTVFSVPATYGEAFGLYVLEALACAVPVVEPRHGAFPELIEQTGGGILCQPDDTPALADALEQLLLDPPQARRLAEQGRAAVQKNFTLERMAENVEAVLTRTTQAAGRPGR